MAHFALQNGPFYSAKWAVSGREMGRFANHYGWGREQTWPEAWEYVVWTVGKCGIGSGRMRLRPCGWMCATALLACGCCMAVWRVCGPCICCDFVADKLKNRYSCTKITWWVSIIWKYYILLQMTNNLDKEIKNILTNYFVYMLLTLGMVLLLLTKQTNNEQRLL